MLQTMQTAVEVAINDDLREARRRLECWGNWLRAIVIRDIGYPAQSPFAQQHTGAAVDYDDAEAEEIEALLAQMMNTPARVVQYKALVQAYYFRATVRAGSERVRVPRTTYCRELERGEVFVAAWLFNYRGDNEIK